MSMDIAAQNRHRVLDLAQTSLLAGGSLAPFMATAYVFFGPQGIVFAIIFGAVSLLCGFPRDGAADVPRAASRAPPHGTPRIHVRRGGVCW